MLDLLINSSNTGQRYLMNGISGEPVNGIFGESTSANKEFKPYKNFTNWWNEISKYILSFYGQKLSYVHLSHMRISQIGGMKYQYIFCHFMAKN